MSKDDLDLEDDMTLNDFEDDDGFDDFDSDFDMFAEEPIPEGRHPITHSLIKTGRSFTDTYKDDKLDTALSVVDASIPKKLNNEKSNVKSILKSIRTEVDSGKNEIKKEAKPFIDIVEKMTPKGGKLETILNIVKDKLDLREESSYEDNVESAALKAANAVTEILGQQQDKSIYAQIVSDKIKAKSDKSMIELQAVSASNLEFLNKFNQDVVSRYQRKSLELQYRHLFTAEEQLDITKTAFDGFKNQLESIVINSALPDLVKTHNSEFIKQKLFSNITDGLFKSEGTINNIKTKFAEEIRNVATNVAGGLGATKDHLEAMDGMSDMTQMAGGTEGIAGTMLADALNSYVGGKVGDFIGKTSLGSKAIDRVQDFMIDPSEALKSKSEGMKEGFLKDSINFASRITANDANEQSFGIGPVNRDEPALFDGKDKTSLNKVIPGLLSKILNEVTSIRKGSKELDDEVRFNHDTGTFQTTSELKGNLSKSIKRSLENSDMDNNITEIYNDIVEAGNLKLSVIDKKKVKQAILKFVLAGKPIYPGRLRENGFYDELPEKLANKIESSMNIYFNDSSNKVKFSNNLSSIRSKAPSPQEFLNSLNDNNSLDLLLEKGLVKFDDTNKTYKLDNDEYKGMLSTALKEMDNDTYGKNYNFGIGGIKRFKKGGYTGSGDTNQFAGFVHKDEEVVNSEKLDKIAEVLNVKDVSRDKLVDTLIDTTVDLKSTIKTMGNSSINTIRSKTSDLYTYVDNSVTDIINDKDLTSKKLKVKSYIQSVHEEIYKVEEYIASNPVNIESVKTDLNKLKSNLISLDKIDVRDNHRINAIMNTTNSKIANVVESLTPNKDVLVAKNDKVGLTVYQDDEDTFLDIINSDNPVEAMRLKIKSSVKEKTRGFAYGMAKKVFNTGSRIIKNDLNRGRKLRGFLRNKFLNNNNPEKQGYVQKGLLSTFGFMDKISEFADDTRVIEPKEKIRFLNNIDPISNESISIPKEPMHEVRNGSLSNVVNTVKESTKLPDTTISVKSISNVAANPMSKVKEVNNNIDALDIIGIIEKSLMEDSPKDRILDTKFKTPITENKETGKLLRDDNWHQEPKGMIDKVRSKIDMTIKNIKSVVKNNVIEPDEVETIFKTSDMLDNLGVDTTVSSKYIDKSNHTVSVLKNGFKLVVDAILTSNTGKTVSGLVTNVKNTANNMLNDIADNTETGKRAKTLVGAARQRINSWKNILKGRGDVDNDLEAYSLLHRENDFKTNTTLNEIKEALVEKEDSNILRNTLIAGSVAYIGSNLDNLKGIMEGISTTASFIWDASKGAFNVGKNIYNAIVSGFKGLKSALGWVGDMFGLGSNEKETKESLTESIGDRANNINNNKIALREAIKNNDEERANKLHKEILSDEESLEKDVNRLNNFDTIKAEEKSIEESESQQNLAKNLTMGALGVYAAKKTYNVSKGVVDKTKKVSASIKNIKSKFAKNPVSPDVGIDDVKNKPEVKTNVKNVNRRTSVRNKDFLKVKTPKKPDGSKIMKILKSFKDKIVKKLGPSASKKILKTLAKKITARLMPIAGTALLLYDAGTIAYNMIAKDMKLEEAVSLTILGQNIFDDNEPIKDDNGIPIKPDERLSPQKQKAIDKAIDDEKIDDSSLFSNIKGFFGFDNDTKIPDEDQLSIEKIKELTASKYDEAYKYSSEKLLGSYDYGKGKYDEYKKFTSDTTSNIFKNVKDNASSLVDLTKRPRNKDDVFNMLDRVGDVTGVEAHVLKTFAAIESGLNPYARASTSSAKGLFQFINSTWKETVDKHGDKYGITRRTNPFNAEANSLMGAEFLKDNAKYLSKFKKDINITDLYLAHFMGPGGAKKFLKANPNEYGYRRFPDQASANRGIFYNRSGRPRTLGQIYDLFTLKTKKKAKNFGISLPSLPSLNEVLGKDSDQAKVANNIDYKTPLKNKTLSSEKISSNLNKNLKLDNALANASILSTKPVVDKIDIRSTVAGPAMSTEFIDDETLSSTVRKPSSIKTSVKVPEVKTTATIKQPEVINETPSIDVMKETSNDIKNISKTLTDSLSVQRATLEAIRKLDRTTSSLKDRELKLNDLEKLDVKNEEKNRWDQPLENSQNASMKFKRKRFA